MKASQPSFCWENAEVEIAIRYGLKKYQVNFSGPFARLGSHPKCEIQVPFGHSSLLAFLQVVHGGVAVVTLPPEGANRCQTRFVAIGDSLSLNSPITISVVSIEHREPAPHLNGFSHHSTAIPDSLLLIKGTVKGRLSDASFLVATGISILGRSESCQLNLRHRTIAPYQCAIIRSDGNSPCVRVVDLFSQHSTKVGDQMARGQKLHVEDVLTLGKLIFVAKKTGNGDVLRLPFYEQPLNRPTSVAGYESQIFDPHQESEIVNALVHSHIVSTQQQVDSNGSSEIHLLLSELTQNVASLVARIEKIESSLGSSPQQLREPSFVVGSAETNEITELACNNASPPSAQSTIPKNETQCSERIDSFQQVEKQTLPKPITVPSHFSESLVPTKDSPDASDLDDASDFEEFPAEARVLGQLIELRTRSGFRHRLRLILTTVACFALAAFVIATVWSRVPSGWRERIWQFNADIPSH